MARTMMGAGELRVRSICELLSESFHVPEYQRGYRWTPREVTALLEDLANFQQAAGAPGTHIYYCLQPIVVRRRDDERWDLVDGQQRLTTVRLVLHVLRGLAEQIGKRPFRISYATRPDSEDFLGNPTAGGAIDNVDFHYMYQAYCAIEAWFASRDGTDRIDLLNCLTRADDKGPNVRVIWYELDQDEKPEDAFIRLNAGRIALTSAELIRAALLRSDLAPIDSRDAHQIAQEWDLLERRLHDDAYWYFLQSATDPPATRIGYLLDLFVAVRGERPPTADGDPLATYLTFQRIILEPKGDKPSAMAIWREFDHMTEVLEAWFNDSSLFHLVGYLVATAPGKARDASSMRRAGAEVLRSLLDARRRMTATDFDRHLRWLAWHRFLGTPKLPDWPGRLPREEYEKARDERLDELDYGHEGVVRALLLFNIAGLLEIVEAQRKRDAETNDASAAPRFQFARFARESWDIEHVRSVADYIPKTPGDRKGWLKHARRFANRTFASRAEQGVASALVAQIDSILAEAAPEEHAFQRVFDGVRALSKEAEAREGDDDLSNLVLLDTHTNRGYKNAIFPVKRDWILDLDREGKYVPPATRNVFLKYYSPDAAQLLLWDAQDQEAYGQALRSTFDRFFAPLAEDRQ